MLNYYPILIKSRIIHKGPLGSYRFELHDNCKAHGRIQYTYVLFVYASNEDVPSLCIAAENAIYPEGELIFGIFAEDGHHNHGIQPEIADVKIFFQRAIHSARRFMVF